MLVAERIARSATNPRRFLRWYLGRWEDNKLMPRDFESCVEECLCDHGADVIDVVLMCTYNEAGYIQVKVGVQTFTADEPEWMSRFVDTVGRNNMRARTVVVMVLVNMIQDDER